MKLINLKQLPLFMVALLSTSSAFAIPLGTTPVLSAVSTSRDVDNGYAGLKWTLGGSFVPEVVVGFRHANVSSDGNTYGGDVSFSFQVWGGLQPGKIRLKYFNGADYLQGEVGGGYDFNKGFFAGISGNAPFSNVGVDYHFNDSVPLVPYFMLDSLGQYRKPRVSTIITCPSGQAYDPVFGCGVLN